MGDGPSALGAGVVPAQLVISDIGLPGEDGYTLLGGWRWPSAQHPPAGGGADRVRRRGARAAGARGRVLRLHIPKPVDPGAAGDLADLRLGSTR